MLANSSHWRPGSGGAQFSPVTDPFEKQILDLPPSQKWILNPHQEIVVGIAGLVPGRTALLAARVAHGTTSRTIWL
jgi:hypothetical protein